MQLFQVKYQNTEFLEEDYRNCYLNKASDHPHFLYYIRPSFK